MGYMWAMSENGIFILVTLAAFVLALGVSRYLEWRVEKGD